LAHDTPGKQGRRGAQKGTWQPLFAAVPEPDLDWGLLDVTIGGAQAQAAGSQKKVRSAAKPSAVAAAG